MTAPDVLVTHLRSWIGAWPPSGPGIDVVSSRSRTAPCWDGAPRHLLGVGAPEGRAVITVTPAAHRATAELLHGRPIDALQDPAVRAAVGEAVVGPGHSLGAGVMRWATHVDDALPPVGRWLPVTDVRVPPWLHPFGGEVLVVLEEDRYVAGAGLKRHGPTGWEIAVGTEASHRGRGLARRLTATAARFALQHVPVVSYHHDPTNVASARVADAAGLPDAGWRIIGVFGGE